MLALTLLEGDYFTLGENIKVKIDRVTLMGSVSVAIEAPREIKISRSKLIQRELDEKAAKSGDPKLLEASAKMAEEQAENYAEYRRRRNIRSGYVKRMTAGEIPSPTVPRRAQKVAEE